MSTIDVLQAAILGLIQGLTEWLPVSSSGHLALVQLALNMRVPVFFDLALHLGTIVGVFILYRCDIVGIFTRCRDGEANSLKYPQGRTTLTLLILGTIPTAIIGFAFKSFFEQSFIDPLALGVGFLVTGGFLLITGFLKPGTKRLGKVDAVIIGIGQGLSIFSSISRSGATIAAGMFRGVEREQLVRYSFLLSIPAILGASALDVATSTHEEHAEIFAIPAQSYIAGILTAGVVGYLSIRALIGLVLTGKFYAFAFYCFAVGIATLIFL